MVQRTKYQNIPVLAATVHKFQGSERDMMIFDTVDSYPQERPGVLFFDAKPSPRQCSSDKGEEVHSIIRLPLYA